MINVQSPTFDERVQHDFQRESTRDVIAGDNKMLPFMEIRATKSKVRCGKKSHLCRRL